MDMQEKVFHDIRDGVQASTDSILKDFLGKELTKLVYGKIQDF